MTALVALFLAVTYFLLAGAAVRGIRAWLRYTDERAMREFDQQIRLAAMQHGSATPDDVQ